jgi:hypothetical protein
MLFKYLILKEVKPMWWNKRKRSSKTSPSDPKEVKKNTSSQLNEPHGMTLNRPFGETKGKVESIFNENGVKLTITLTHSTLTLKELSLLLDVLNYQAVTFGINFNMALALYDLFLRLTGSRQTNEISDKYIRKTVTVTEIILKELKGFDWDLWSGSTIWLDPNLKEILRHGLMSKRTYGSRYRTWRPEKFLRVVIVPLDDLYFQRRKDTQRYSSYTKGYGESHPDAHKSKTRSSSELDGEPVRDWFTDEQIKLFKRCTDPVLILSEIMLLKYQNLLWEREQK